jgi:GTP diphosphokinase / guanosine-3',5'-bis(diphosphate) 3'-diphosphatase
MTFTLQEIEQKYIDAYNHLIQELKLRKSNKKNDMVERVFLDFYAKHRQAPGSGSDTTKDDVVITLLNTASIAVSEIGLGHTSIISLFIYHTLGQKPDNFDDIRKKHGRDTVIIVEGLLNVNKLGEKSVSSQAENFRRLLLNLAKDVRVILIILAEQMAVMRNMKSLEQDKQFRIASEAAYLYAPLAHRLGLYLIKSEMEDISLKYTNRETYSMIARKLDETMRARTSFIDNFIKPIRETLKNQGFTFEIKGRPKSIHSIWNKMRKKEVDFEDIYDLFAIRIIIKSDLSNEKANCWQVYSAVTDIFQPNPLRLRDWISIPKTNGYESLHTTVIGPEGKWVEVQIRTERMNEIAEKGVAAHWKYKGLEGEKGLDNWLAKIREILETPEPDAGDFINDFKLSLYSKEIFVFTPKGDLKKFPEGSTVLDFAYDVHTQVGASCTGAKINSKAVPIRHKLQNGDKVEVLTSKNQKPKLDWLNFVVTSRAQKKIRQALNEEKLKEAENGKEIIKRRFKNWKIEYNDEIIRNLLKKYKLPNAQEFYSLISVNKIDLTEIKEFILGDQTEEQTETNTLETLETSKADTTIGQSKDFLIIDEKVANVDYKLAKCCSPILGDNIFGFVTINEGIKIHRTNCPNAVQLIGKYGYRVVSARWSRKDPASIFPVTLKITGEEQAGILNNISEILSKDSGIHLRSIKLDTNDGAFNGTLGISVRDLNHLDFIIQRLSALKGIYSVSRMENL